MTQCRLIMTATSLSKVIEAVRSRCLNIRISAPDNQTIITILNNAAKKEVMQFSTQVKKTMAIA